MRLDFSEESLGKGHALLQTLFVRQIAFDVAIKALIDVSPAAQQRLAAMSRASADALLQFPLSDEMLEQVRSHLAILSTPPK